MYKTGCKPVNRGTSMGCCVHQTMTVFEAHLCKTDQVWTNYDGQASYKKVVRLKFLCEGGRRGG